MTLSRVRRRSPPAATSRSSTGTATRRVRALDGVDLEIAPDERVALLGRSGSGKTTLLHVLGGLVEPTAGERRVARAAARRRSTQPRAEPGARAGIAYVFQGANLLPHFTAFENVAFAALALGATVDRRPAPLALLELVGLAAKADHLPAELSGGEAQRVALARALAQQPELLLCDEPTGHLDSDTGERVLDLIEALQERVRLRARRRHARPGRRRAARPRGRARRRPRRCGRRGVSAVAPTRARRARARARRGRRVRVLLARRRGGAARRDAPLRRPLAADDDRDAPSAACRSTGRGRSARYGRRNERRRRRRAASRASPQAVAGRDGAVRRGRAHGAAVGHDPLRRRVDPRRPARLPRAHPTPSASCAGSLRPGEIVLDQQLAATLQAQIGDTVRLTPRSRRAAAALPGERDRARHRPGRPLPAAQPAARPGAGAAARRTSRSSRSPPSPRTLAPALPTISPRRPARARRPRRADRRPVAGAGPGRPGARSAGSPAQRAQRRRRRSATASSARFPARSSSSTTSPTALNTAAGDALYAETLYIMLAVPGALVALGLAYLAALGTVERDRRDLALLRARGARAPRPARARRASRACVIGLLAGVLGTGARARAPFSSLGSAAGSARARVLATLRRLRRARHRGRRGRAARRASLRRLPRRRSARAARSVRRHGAPLWQRLYLDLVCARGQRARSTG